MKLTTASAFLYKEDYHYELKQILNSVSDIVRIKEPSPEDLYDDYEAVIKYVEKLRDDILDLEAKHKREDFVEFNEVKARLTSFMDEVSSKDRSFKENYQTKAVSGLDSFADYNTALMAAERYIESTQERYEKALAAEAIRIEKLKAEQRIVDGTVKVVASVAVVAGIIFLSGGALAPAAIPTVIFAYGELTEGANDIYLGLEGDGSSRAFNHIRDTVFLGNQLTYDIAAFGLDIGAIKFSKPTITNLNQVVKYGAKSTTSGSTSRIKELTKKLLGKVDDVKNISAVNKAGKYSETEIRNIISNLKGDGFKNNPLRQAYESEVAGLKEHGQKLLSEGRSEEYVARTLNQARRNLGIKYKNATPQPLRDYIYEINMRRYGDKLGPTYDWLVSEKGATNTEIIRSSSQPNSDIDRLLQGFEQWLRRQ